MTMLLGLLLLIPHGGGLDSLGCHHDRQRGGYHCHRGPLAGRSFASKVEAERALKEQQPKSSEAQPEILWRSVLRVVDGDTIVLEREEKVRLIGVDTPETVDPRRPVQRFGKEASTFTRRMVEGKKVRLEYDREGTDRYGRTLAYVYLEDGTFLNAEIIRQGYGFAYTRFPFKFLGEFRGYEREAREEKLGLWGAP